MSRDSVNAETQLRAVQAFASAMLGRHTLDDLLWNIAELVGDLLGFDDCVIYLREGDVLVQASAFGLKNPSPGVIKDPILIPIGDGIVGTAALIGQAEYVPDTVADQRYIADQYEGLSELAVPVRFEGRVIGVFDSESERLDDYSEEDQALFQLIADLSGARIAWLQSERSRLASAEQASNDRLEALGLLAGGIAHDFNNMLGVVALNVEGVRFSESPEMQDASLAVIEDVIRRAAGLTKQLVTLSAGGAPLQRLLDPLPLLNSALELLSSMPGIQAELKTFGDLPMVNADEIQLGQVLHNLLLNAAESMGGEGPVTVNARACATEEGVGLLVEVIDQGPGIPEAKRSQIFDPYFSTKKRGSGLGLATAHAIVTRHGGTLSAHPGAETGTLLRLVMPALHGKLPDEMADSLDVRLPPLKILVLEDDPLVATGLQALLEQQGHEVIWVVDGAMVVDTWDRATMAGSPFDLALVDLNNSQGMDGAPAMRALLRRDPYAIGIAMSGYSEDAALRDPASAGFKGRLEKPFDWKALRRELVSALGL